ncbi:MAG: hypothetical protein BVN35_21550 [Proteobacteria bacterium ST_bin11]|nr:MAG: hypothetical protein BVN35_21550 [Proteobacteria bacterium ST_bin11]
MKKSTAFDRRYFGSVDTAFGRRTNGIRPTRTRHSTDGGTAFGRQTRHSTDKKHGIRPTFYTAFDRRSVRFLESLQVTIGVAYSDFQRPKKSGANLFIIFF